MIQGQEKWFLSCKITLQLSAFLILEQDGWRPIPGLTFLLDIQTRGDRTGRENWRPRIPKSITSVFPVSSSNLIQGIWSCWASAFLSMKWRHFKLWLEYTNLSIEVKYLQILLLRAINMVFDQATYNGNKNEEEARSWKYYIAHRGSGPWEPGWWINI